MRSPAKKLRWVFRRFARSQSPSSTSAGRASGFTYFPLRASPRVDPVLDHHSRAALPLHAEDVHHLAPRRALRPRLDTAFPRVRAAVDAVLHGEARRDARGLG
jgi:hypothetical protein